MTMMMLGVSKRVSSLARSAHLKRSIDNNRRVLSSASRSACIPAASVFSQDTKSTNQLLAAAAGLFAFYGIGSNSIDSTTKHSRTQLEAVAAQFDVGEDLRNLADSSSVSESSTENDEDEETTNVMNWSGTHMVTVKNKNYWEPESVEEVEKIIKECHEKGQPVRPVGASLSPNGIALNADGMISMAHLDKVIEIDKKRMTVTAQAGVTVNQLVEALRPHGLTLPNLASIAEQQLGGFVQVGAHGTGKTIAPVDHYVTKLKIVTPGMGTLELSPKRYPSAFQLAKVGLGCLGVVVEVTMQCIPAHRLVEHTFVLTRTEAREQLETLMDRHKHVRYMWIPYTDAVVVVTNDPEDQVPNILKNEGMAMESAEERAKPLTDLLVELSKDTDTPYTPEMMKGMGFGELRDALLAIGPLDLEHVQKCNQAEAEFWRRSEGYRSDWSDRQLQFDCGGQQWVFEVCFPTGTQDENSGNDMLFMERLLSGIEQLKIPAHSPIEQRWSAASSSVMSPAHGPSHGLYTWVGIINYLPSDDEKQREEITENFKGLYCDLVRSIGRPVKATSHWAKLEHPESVWRTVDLQFLLQKRYPVKDFNKARAKLDPKGILSTPLMNLAFGNPTEES